MQTPQSQHPAVSLRSVTRDFRLPGGVVRTAVNDVSLDVPAGCVFGLLGANGAGKTTTIKMLLGFLGPTRGELRIFGCPTAEPESRACVGYLPEQPWFHQFLSPTEALRMHAELIGLPRRQRDEQVSRLLELTRLQKNSRIPLAKLSKGNQQRVGIAVALLGDPKLLVLDEPTSGLDPLGRHEMRQIIAGARTEGRTVLLSSHVLAEVDSLCDQVAILREGRLVACGAPAEVKQGRQCFVVTTPYVTRESEAALAALGAEIEHGAEVQIHVAQSEVFSVIRALEEHGLALTSVSGVSETLESAFLRLAA